MDYSQPALMGTPQGVLSSFFTDPSQASLLGVATGLLQAGGPQPFPMSLGQGLAQGYNIGLRNAQTAQQLQMQRALQQQQLIGAMLGNRFMGWKVGLLDQADQAQGPQPSAPAAAAPTTQADVAPGGNANPNGMPAWASQTIQSGQAPSTYTAPQQAPQMSPNGMPLVPGFDASGSLRVAAGAYSPEYVRAISSANMPTDQLKLIAAARAGDPDAQQLLAKQQYIAPPSFRPGGWTIINGQWKYLPRLPEGSAPLDASNPGAGIAVIPGTPEAVGAMAYPQAAAKAAVTPATGVVGGQPAFVPGGALAAAQGPGATFPGGPGYRPTQAPSPRSTAPAPQGTAPSASAPQAGAVRPDYAPGYKEGQSALATAGAKRYNDTLQLAAESPMRVNVLDNIISLSAQGTSTGPGSEWQNAVLGYAANTPLLGRLMAGATDNVSKFQEIQKFTYQNALRNWQAAGGTGTDAQMLAASHANPNDKLFPQALQQIAKWAKASELALQAKANAQDKWLAANGNDISKQNQFEAQWRDHFDPRVYQLSLMTPQEAIAYKKGLSTADQAAVTRAIIYARQQGWVQQ